ncbi:MAG: tetratricopeptide repeat protein [Bdellovibrio sp.]
MKNQTSFFIVFCLCLTVGLVSIYSIFVGYFDGHERYEKSLSSLQEQVDKEKLNNSLLTYQLNDFQQAVAQALPDEKQLQAKYALRTLASVVRMPSSIETLDLSTAYYEKSKKFFVDKNYDKAIPEFYSLLEKYPLSKHIVEAHFFIAESYFLKNDFRNSLAEIDKMVTHYPDHDLTGFILLRMGQISEMNNQTQEAAEVYRAVLKNFKNETLKKQAQMLVKNIEGK